MSLISSTPATTTSAVSRCRPVADTSRWAACSQAAQRMMELDGALVQEADLGPRAAGE